MTRHFHVSGDHWSLFLLSVVTHDLVFTGSYLGIRFLPLMCYFHLESSHCHIEILFLGVIFVCFCFFGAYLGRPSLPPDHKLMVSSIFL